MAQELNAAEERFFKSGGRDVDATLREGLGGAAGGGGSGRGGTDSGGDAGGSGGGANAGAQGGAGGGDRGEGAEAGGAAKGGARTDAGEGGGAAAAEAGGGQQQGAQGEGQGQPARGAEANTDEHVRNLNAALSQERAEKKQLRDELKAYREWQQRLVADFNASGGGQGQQGGQGQGAQGAPIQVPDPAVDPLGYVNHMLGKAQEDVKGLQDWRQLQENEARRQGAIRQLSDWGSAQEAEFTKTQPAYNDAYEYAANARRTELRALGYNERQVAKIISDNAIELIYTAAQRGVNPAQVVWDFAAARGFKPGAPKNGAGNGAGQGHGGNGAGAQGQQQGAGVDPAAQERAQRQIAEGQAAAGKNGGGDAGGPTGNFKDLSNIDDPDEFEKEWNRLFGVKDKPSAKARRH